MCAQMYGIGSIWFWVWTNRLFNWLSWAMQSSTPQAGIYRLQSLQSSYFLGDLPLNFIFFLNSFELDLHLRSDDTLAPFHHIFFEYSLMNVCHSGISVFLIRSLFIDLIICGSSRSYFCCFLYGTNLVFFSCLTQCAHWFRLWERILFNAKKVVLYARFSTLIRMLNLSTNGEALLKAGAYESIHLLLSCLLSEWHLSFKVIEQKLIVRVCKLCDLVSFLTWNHG